MSTHESASATGRQIRLFDGRALAYAEYGLSDGKPVFFFQGTPSSRLFHHPDESIAVSLGARIITIDRPGFGLSDPKPNRTLLDWPDDVMELADALALEQFAVGGISGGGPYVAACAQKIPHRLTKAGIVSGGGPTDTPVGTEGMSRQRRIGATVARLVPGLLPALLGLMSNPHRDPDKFFEDIYSQSSDTDQAILARPEIRAMLVENWLEATRPGVDGYAHEARLFSTPWGFQLQDITMLVHLWHGTDDRSTPLTMAYHMWHTIPRCRAKFFPGEGHFLLFDHWEEILATLVA